MEQKKNRMVQTNILNNKTKQNKSQKEKKKKEVILIGTFF